MNVYTHLGLEDAAAEMARMEEVENDKKDQDPEFKKEYEALQPEHAIIQAIIDARQQSGLTQKELSERTGIAQGDISKLERGNANPSIRTLQRLAAGMGMKLRLEFLPDVDGAVLKR